MSKRDDTGDLHALEKQNELLESLSDVGVSLAGSFDIEAILRTTHDAARRFGHCDSADVLYLGCEPINSRLMWFPSEPSEGGLDEAAREAIVARVRNRRLSPDDPFLPETVTRCLPIGYQNERMGYLFLGSPSATGPQADRPLEILTLQAATALRNIHLTQERIHFERLSAIGRMIGSVVHDFRSPLTALRGYVGMLTNLNLDDADRAAYGQHVIEECDRLNHMVSELLEFTRGGRVALEPVPVRLGGFIETLADRLRAQFGPRGVEIELDLAEVGEIPIDKERMERAIWNVATNACQAMPDGGRLVIRTEAKEETVIVTLEDEGNGIPEEVQHRIFEPFFSYGKSEGIGLGMAIARKITEEHGGTLAVTSRKGVGTRVKFELPKVTAAESAEVEVASERA